MSQRSNCWSRLFAATRRYSSLTLGQAGRREVQQQAEGRADGKRVPARKYLERLRVIRDMFPEDRPTPRTIDSDEGAYRPRTRRGPYVRPAC